MTLLAILFIILLVPAIALVFLGLFSAEDFYFVGALMCGLLLATCFFYGIIDETEKCTVSEGEILIVSCPFGTYYYDNGTLRYAPVVVSEYIVTYLLDGSLEKLVLELKDYGPQIQTFITDGQMLLRIIKTESWDGFGIHHEEHPNYELYIPDMRSLGATT